MTYVTVVDDSPARTVENLDKLMTDILPEPDGLAARYAGMVDGKLCIVAIWDSREHAQAFMPSDSAPGCANCSTRPRPIRHEPWASRSSTPTCGRAAIVASMRSPARRWFELSTLAVSISELA